MPEQVVDVAKLNEAVREESLLVQAAVNEMKKVIVGQKTLLDRMMITLLCRGHLLVEGLPGLAKTLAVKTMGQVLDLQFSRIQFTPDLLPADLTGTLIFVQKTGEFAARKGPVFTNLLLADEINRAPAKVQSALLEAMQERQVTLGDASHPLPAPFMVFATQNPIEQEGTYPLPEAQIDRFLLKAKVDYPKPDEERLIFDRMLMGEIPSVSRVLKADAINRLGQRVREIYIDERLRDYMVSLVTATRPRPRDRAGRHRAADRLRRLAARDAGVLRSLPRQRVPARPRLRRARGREGDRQGRAAASHPAHVRSRGGERHHRHGGGSDSRARRSALSATSMLDRETFSRIRRVQIRTRTILESGIGGAYHAVFKGRGMEFAEVREYQPGDDVRTIDWNVTARMGSLHIKKFVEERDLTLLLVVDVSGSQAFGSDVRLKRDYAAELAAVLAFSAVLESRPRRRGAVLRPHRGLRAAQPGPRSTRCASCATCSRAPQGRGTDIAGALRFAQRVMKRRGIVAVISDFQGEATRRAWARCAGVTT
jgi:MoxR-like ATPase